ncbi:MAG: UDP-N-acetylglucosamine 2-epimerase (hydrolyzing) [Legionellales bacterium]|nr:UDP-N-acetylglucosamine 2-epimerase (hydrolyzing) [Legionellales bacterium]
MKRKVCVVTGSRAEYGLLRWVLEGIKSNPKLELQIVATGMHLSPEFGSTYREIESDGFKIDSKVEMLVSSDTSIGLSKSVGLGLIGISETLDRLMPDLLLVLGDRFEILSSVVSALLANIPIAHIHGGEITEGAFDDAIRHSITKMSHLHFVSTDENRARVMQLGESSEHVFTVGGLGVDSIKKTNLLNREDFEKSIDFKLNIKNLLVTFHPVTLEYAESIQQLSELLLALENLKDTNIIFTTPNADLESRKMLSMINTFVDNHPNAKFYNSLGQLRYYSCIKHVDGVVGNSSSGLLEVPTFNKGTVNIGDRQKGRPKASSVIDCEPNLKSITDAICELYSEKFQSVLVNITNPYGDGGASEKIVKIISEQSLDSILKKTFCDLTN